MFTIPAPEKEKNLYQTLLHPQFKLVEDNLATMALVKVLKGTEAVVASGGPARGSGFLGNLLSPLCHQ